MNIHKLSQGQAAALAGVTTRRLRQMAHEDNAPAQDRGGRYPAAEFARWLASTKRVPKLTDDDREASMEAEITRLIANYAGGVLEWQKPRDAFLVMCIDAGLTRQHALIAYSMQAFSLGYAAEETTEQEDFGIAIPPDGFWYAVTKAIRDKTLDAFIAERWPDKVTSA